MRRSNRAIWAGALLSTAVMACVLPVAATPLNTPALLPLNSDQLGTTIAQTSVAALTSTAAHAPTWTTTPTIPTASVTPTSAITFTASATPLFLTFPATYTVSVPTLTQVVFTPVPVSVSKPVSISTARNGSVPAATLSDKDRRATLYPKIPLEWNCTVVEKYPSKGMTVKANSDLYLSWKILNTGTKTWTNNAIDFVNTGGFGQEGKHIQDLQTTVAPGQIATLKILVHTPKAAGSYNVYWSLRVGHTLFCHMKGTFEVK
ncbi:MAG: hypothetical protein K8S20_16235 [Chloroflexi bacterium]|nr:hypothetical protein [Chloroflexota bacterium]